MDRQTPVPGEFYQHFKGMIYQIRCLAEHSESGELLVIYQALYGDFRIYARPLDQFLSEVDRLNYPTASARYRFTKIDPGQLNSQQTNPPFGRFLGRKNTGSSVFHVFRCRKQPGTSGSFGAAQKESHSANGRQLSRFHGFGTSRAIHRRRCGIDRGSHSYQSKI